MDKIIDVSKRYNTEISNINNKLNQLENGRIYELTGAKMDGYMFNNIERLRKGLLLCK